MDPDACCEALIKALMDDDLDAVDECGTALENWLQDGGFPPHASKLSRAIAFVAARGIHGDAISNPHNILATLAFAVGCLEKAI
jgi:hypothetical protein